MIKTLVIDDKRSFFFPATYLRTAEEIDLFLEAKEHWDEVWLDHDLGLDFTGVDIANTIENLTNNGIRFDVDLFVIHSANPVGREQMKAALRNYNVRMVRAEDYM